MSDPVVEGPEYRLRTGGGGGGPWAAPRPGCAVLGPAFNKAPAVGGCRGERWFWEVAMFVDKGVMCCVADTCTSTASQA